LVNQERSFACAEIESARAVVQRFGEALEEEEKLAQTSGKQVCKRVYYYYFFNNHNCYMPEHSYTQI